MSCQQESYNPSAVFLRNTYAPWNACYLYSVYRHSLAAYFQQQAQEAAVQVYHQQMAAYHNVGLAAQFGYIPAQQPHYSFRPSI